jgi:DHA1 family tetracycline resistance protein-like MFS transporter
LFPLYLVVFVGFLGYSLMIATSTPMILRNDNGMLPASSSLTGRSLALGALLALYPLGQFLGSPVVGTLWDRYERRPLLIASLSATTVLYGGIAAALVLQSLPLLMIACFLAGLSKSDIVIAQGAIADTQSRADRNRFVRLHIPQREPSVCRWAACRVESWPTPHLSAGSVMTHCIGR